jgi:hypothetical protein
MDYLLNCVNPELSTLSTCLEYSKAVAPYSGSLYSLLGITDHSVPSSVINEAARPCLEALIQFRNLSSSERRLLRPHHHHCNKLTQALETLLFEDTRLAYHVQWQCDWICADLEGVPEERCEDWGFVGRARREASREMWGIEKLREWFGGDCGLSESRSSPDSDHESPPKGRVRFADGNGFRQVEAALRWRGSGQPMVAF